MDEADHGHGADAEKGTFPKLCLFSNSVLFDAERGPPCFLLTSQGLCRLSQTYHFISSTTLLAVS